MRDEWTKPMTDEQLEEPLRKLIEAVEGGSWDCWDNGKAALKPFDAGSMSLVVNAYKGSLNAAKALHEALLPGWFPGMSQNIHNGYWYAWVQTREDRHFSATESDPARAWLLATLKAYEAQQ